MTVTVSGAAVAYGGREVLSDIDLHITAPGTVAVIGPNGAGKTTLLRLIAGLVDPSRGTVTLSFDGTVTSPHRAAGRVAVVEQEPREHSWMPVNARDVMVIAHFPDLGSWRRPGRAVRRAIAGAAEQLGIVDLLDHRFAELSGGQRQRVRLAAALSSSADVLVLDEPTNGLDPHAQDLVRSSVHGAARRGRLVIASTHDLGDARTADRVVVVAGTIAADGSPPDVLQPERLSAVYGSKLEARDGRIVRIHDEHGAHSSHSGHDH